MHDKPWYLYFKFSVQVALLQLPFIGCHTNHSKCLQPPDWCFFLFTENPEKEKPLKNLKTTNDAVATSSQFEPAVMVVIGCDVKILTVVETKLEDVLRNHLIEREVKVCDFDRLTHQEQETVLSEVRASGMSMEFRSAPGKAKGKNAEGAVDHYLLRGLKEDVLSVFALISDAVRNYLFEDNQNNQENLMAMIARWYIQDKKKEVWQLLDQKENCELETAHRDKKTSAKITAPDGTVAQVNLKTYTATSQQGTKYKVKKSEISEGTLCGICDFFYSG